MTSHPEVEALAFFAEGLLEPDEESSVARHVESCADCSKALDELTDVSQVLAAAPAPELPQEAADRLEQQIAEAVRDRALHGSDPSGNGAEADTEPTGAVPVADLSERRGRRFGLPRLMMVAAAAVFVIGGGVAVVNGVFGEDEEPGVAAPLEDSPEAEEEGEPDAAQSYTPDLVRSGTSYTEDGLDEQAAATLERSPMGGSGGPGTLEDPPGDGADDTEQLPPEANLPPGAEECASAAGEELGLHVAMIDHALYGADAEPAWVLFAPDGDEIQVLVVEDGCEPGDDISENILAQETVDAG